MSPSAGGLQCHSVADCKRSTCLCPPGPPEQLGQEPVAELGIDGSVAHEDSEEHRTVEQVENDVDVEVTANVSRLHRRLQEGAALLSSRENEVITKRLRELSFGLGSRQHHRDVASRAGRECLRDLPELRT